MLPGPIGSRSPLDRCRRGISSATGSTTDSSLSDPFPKGESGEAFGWTVKVVDFNPNANDVVEQANQFNAPPRKGTYAIATVRFTRTEGKSSDPYFDMQASLVVRGQTFPESDEACCLPDGWDAINKVPTGGRASDGYHSTFRGLGLTVQSSSW
jgi:hypothetical protein